jgi:hypothetical protein
LFGNKDGLDLFVTCDSSVPLFIFWLLERRGDRKENKAMKNGWNKLMVNGNERKEKGEKREKKKGKRGEERIGEWR